MSRYNTDRAEREEYGSALGRICCLLLLFCCFETVSKMSQLFLAPTGPLVAMMQLHTTIGIGPQQSVTFVKILIRMNVRIYSYQQNYTNEYPNIFILIFLTRANVRISIRIEN